MEPHIAHILYTRAGKKTVCNCVCTRRRHFCLWKFLGLRYSIKFDEGKAKLEYCDIHKYVCLIAN